MIAHVGGTWKLGHKAKLGYLGPSQLFGSDQDNILKPFHTPYVQARGSYGTSYPCCF